MPQNNTHVFKKNQAYILYGSLQVIHQPYIEQLADEGPAVEHSKVYRLQILKSVSTVCEFKDLNATLSKTSN